MENGFLSHSVHTTDPECGRCCLLNQNRSIIVIAVFLLYVFIYFLAVPVIEPRASPAKQVLYHLNHAPSLFVCILFF
jgi:hypothetical protein